MSSNPTQSEFDAAFEQTLLEAGRSDQLPEDRRQRLAASLGVAVLPPLNNAPATPPSDLQPLGNTSAHSALPLSSSRLVTSSSGFGKTAFTIIGGGVVGALAVWGGTHWAPHLAQPDPSSSVVVLQSQEPRRSEAEPSAPVESPVVNQAADAAVSEGRVGAEQAKRKSPVRDALAQELKQIDAARKSLARGDAARTLTQLSAYRAEFPRGRLQAEATVLQIEALVARGDRSTASKIGESFLRRDPNSPYARRVRSLLNSPAESVQ